MTSPGKDSTSHMALGLSFGHGDIHGCNLSSPCRRRGKPGAEAAGTTRKEAPGPFVTVLPSDQPWTAESA